VSEPVLIVVIILFLLLGNGFFSGSEIAVISARRSRIDALAAEGSRAARRVRDLQDNMDRFLATAQIGVTVMGTLAGVLGGYLASRHLDPVIKESWLASFVPASLEAAFVVGVGIVYVELVLGELVPKALALKFTEPVALLVSGPFALMIRLSRWLIAFLTASTRAVLMLFGIRDFGARIFVSEEEIRHLVTEGRALAASNV
jgi:putative hemolysin